MVKDIPTEEEVKEEKRKKKIPKEISQQILKKIFGSLLRAIGIMLYFVVLNLAYSTMKQERLIGDIEVFAGVFLVVGIVLLEMAYKKDDGAIAISGVECLVLSLHSLSIMHVITLFKYDFRYYLLASSYVFSIYYVLKAIVLYTKGRREYLSSLSDISEIVKKDEPVVKEAKKRNIEEKQENKEKVSNKEESNVKKKVENKGTKKKKMPKKETTKKKTETKREAKEESLAIEEKKEKRNKQIDKEEKEVKKLEKKKRGRPKKEVSKND